MRLIEISRRTDGHGFFNVMFYQIIYHSVAADGKGNKIAPGRQKSFGELQYRLVATLFYCFKFRPPVGGKTSNKYVTQSVFHVNAGAEQRKVGKCFKINFYFKWRVAV